MESVSPKFSKPTEVFLLRKKKRLSTQISPPKVAFSPLKCLQSVENSPIKGSPNRKSPFRFQKYFKQRSPFTQNSPNKKKNSTSGRGLKRQLNFQTIDLTCDDENANLEPAINIKKVNEDLNIDFKESYERTPVDWSLKSRARFMSSKPFPWKATFRATEEACGTTSFVRCINFDNESHCSLSPGSNSSCNSQYLDTSKPAALQEKCLIWMHPNLPWLKLFPRGNTVKPGAPLPFIAPHFTIDPQSDLANALYNDWRNSLKSLYQLLKAKQCAYFYVCANSFTALFRASGISAIDEIQALITPTTNGFRKLLLDEGVNFSMPFVDQDQKNACEEPEEKETENKNNGIEIGNENEASTWLESLGLSQQDFPSLSSTKRKKIK